MTPDLPIIPSSKSKTKKLVNNRIHKWTLFSLCFITTLIVVSLIKAYLPLLVSALAMLFVWSQMTKPIAEIETKTTNHDDDSNQLNLFHRQYKIGRKYSKIKKELHEKEDPKVA
jgi:cell division protein FtsL